MTQQPPRPEPPEPYEAETSEAEPGERSHEPERPAGGRRAGRIWTPRNILGILGAMAGMVGVLMFLTAVLVALFFRSAVATIALLVLGTVFLGGGLLLVVLGVALGGAAGKPGRGGLVTTGTAAEDRR